MSKKDLIDSVINEVDYALGVLIRPNNKSCIKDNSLEESKRKKSIKVMRVNHMGEVCAQALYRGQAITTKDEKIKNKLYEICKEEKNHLDLCRKRLDELDGHGSILNSAWYISSFFLGCVAGATSKKWGLGFIEETERQVSTHLDEYIEKLPDEDKKSKEILKDIKTDEEKHKRSARKIGSKELPKEIKVSMDLLSKIMKRLSYRL
tara:strand:- start:23 stop:640 length:618 start_codon:yes stop_codon:yes gene_type:complete